MRDKFVQLRGEPEAIETLLTQLNLEKVQITAPVCSSNSILSKYPKHIIQEELVLMCLANVEENIKMTIDPFDLDPQDAAEIAKLMREINPDWWGDTTTSDIESSFRTSFWVGVRQNEKLVSIGEARFTDGGVTLLLWQLMRDSEAKATQLRSFQRWPRGYVKRLLLFQSLFWAEMQLLSSYTRGSDLSRTGLIWF